MPSLEERPNAELLELWRAGNERAARVLVKRYMARMTALVRSRLSRKLARRVDPDDIVLSAWRSFFVGRDVTVPDNDDIWPLLVTISLRKLSRQATRHTAGRRDIHAEADVGSADNWQQIMARQPTSGDAAALSDEVEAVMRKLDAVERGVLTRYLQGMNTAAIAGELGCSDRTVRRTLERIRETIAAHAAVDSPDVIDATFFSSAEPFAAARTHEPITSQPTVEFEEYRLERLIGQGGFGKIYRATHTANRTTVAVKYLKKRFWKEARAKHSFLHETHIVSRLSHPNIIRHHGWGVSPSGTIFLVMEWIDGGDLRSWRRAMRPSLTEIIGCGIALAEGLCAAHAAGVVHADLTPANVLRREDGSFLLTDFGFAQSLTAERQLGWGGTPNFLAPEQVSDAFGAIGVRTDVYGLGGLLHWLCTGLPPVSGRRVADVLANVLSSDQSTHDIKKVSSPLRDLIDRCLRKEIIERPDDMQHVLDSLLRIRESYDCPGQ